MSRVYDCWEKLVEAVLKREELKQLAFCDSFSTIATDSSSRFDFDYVLDEMPIEVVPDDTSSIHFETTNLELLQIEPRQLQFPFELKKHLSCSIALTNNSDNHVAFKLKTTSPRNYTVNPNPGIVMPHSTCDVIVTMRARNEAPLLMQCKDKFLLQSIVVNPGAIAKDIIMPETFNKESGNQVYGCKLTAAYVHPRLPSPVQEGSEEGCSPRASLSDNGTVNRSSDSNIVSKGLAEKDESRSEVGALILKLSEERDCAIEQNDKLLQELELLRCQDRSSIHFETTNSELLQIEPRQLQFLFELKKHLSCSIALTNNSDNHIAFKLKTTSPKNYTVNPNPGIVMPHSTCDVIVRMQARNEAPPNMECKDKFLIVSVIMNPTAAEKGIISPEIFKEEPGNTVYKSKFRAVYVVPPRLPASVSGDETVNHTEL